MACRKCGGGSPVTPVTPDAAAQMKATGDMVWIEYIGIQEQKQRVKSRVAPHEHYIFGGGQSRFLAYRGDIEWLTAMASRFRLLEIATLLPVGNDLASVPTLSSEIKTPVLTDLPVDSLQLDPITLGLLRRQFSTINEIRNAGRAEWLTIKGIGGIRADEIAEALDAIS
jgi:hypothetical protein